VGDLEALEAIAALSLTTDDLEDVVDQLSTLSVVTLGPVVASTGLAKDEVVGAEELTKGAGADGIHGTGLEIDEDGARDILVAGSLHMISTPIDVQSGYFSTNLVEVDAHTLELKLRGAIVDTVAVEAVLARDGLPESSTNLVALLHTFTVSSTAKDETAGTRERD
jgi:hypothetical protein